jgi:peptide/nickel transport system substrate-binding protein
MLDDMASWIGVSCRGWEEPEIVCVQRRGQFELPSAIVPAVDPGRIGRRRTSLRGPRTREEASVLRTHRSTGSPVRASVAVIALAAIVGTISGCGSSSAATPTMGAPESGAPATAAPTAAVTAAAAECSTGGTLTMARPEEPESLNPWLGHTNGTIFLQMQLFERLVEQAPGSEPGTTVFAPGVAEKWDVSADGLAYTFHLRADRKFSNGDPITAEDVKFSIDRFVNPDVNKFYGFLAANVKDVEIVDADTIKINMKSKDASLVSSLTLMSASIVPQKVMEQLGDEKFGETPVGSGPFMLKQWTRGQNLEIVRNPNYWKAGRPYLDGINFQLVHDDNARVLKAQSGEADVVQLIPIPQVDLIKNLAGYRLEQAPIFAQDNVWLNHTYEIDGKRPFADKLVRQALNYATPKQTLIDVVFNGVGRISNTMGSPTMYLDTSIPPYAYDVDKAKSLLAQSSFPTGFTVPMMVATGDTESQQTAELLKVEWAKLGITVEITPVDPAMHDSVFPELTYGTNLICAACVTSDTPDDGEMASIVFDLDAGFKSFFTGYDSAEVKALVRQAAAEMDPAKRKALYSELQKKTMEDAPTVALVLLPTLTAVSDKVLGFQTLPAGHWLMQDVCKAK